MAESKELREASAAMSNFITNNLHNIRGRLEDNIRDRKDLGKSEIELVALRMTDYDGVMSLIKNAYVPFEPICKGWNLTFEKLNEDFYKPFSLNFEEDLANNYLEKGVSVCAKDKAGEVIGILLVDIISGILYLSRMTVHPKYRRQGIARRMLQIVEQIGRQKRTQNVYAMATGIASQITLHRQGYQNVCETPYKNYDFLNLTHMGNNTSVKLMFKKLI